MFKWLFFFAALLPGLAIGGINGDTTISYNDDGRELRLRNSNKGYWWLHKAMAEGYFEHYYWADLNDINHGDRNPEGRNGHLLKYPSQWTPSDTILDSWEGYKFFSENGEYWHDWPGIKGICEGCEFVVTVPHATNDVVLTFTSSQADGNYEADLYFAGAWRANDSGYPSVPSQHTRYGGVAYYVLDGKVYWGTMATSCDITNPDIEINFGSLPPGTNGIENKTTRLNIICNKSPANMRLSIQGDEYDNQYAVKRGEVVDAYLTLGDCYGPEAHVCEWVSPNGKWDMPLHAKIDTKNKAGAFEEHFIVTVEIL